MWQSGKLCGMKSRSFVERCMGHAASEDDEVCVVMCLLEECMVTINFCPVEHNDKNEWVAAPAA